MPEGSDDRAAEEAVRSFLLDGSRLAGTSSTRRTLTKEDLAAMRPQAPPRPRKRRSPAAAPPPPRPAASEAVFAGIVCFCGQRFGPEQAAEFMTHLRAEVGRDLQLLAKVRKWRRETQTRKRRRSGVAPKEPVTAQQQRERRNTRQRERREAAGKPCACGCGEMTRDGRAWRPGHHQRMEEARAGRRRDPAKVGQARDLYRAGSSAREIGAKMGVHPTTIQRWLAGEMRPAGAPRAAVPDEEIAAMREQEHLTFAEIGRRAALSRAGASKRYSRFVQRREVGS